MRLPPSSFPAEMRRDVDRGVVAADDPLFRGPATALLQRPPLLLESRLVELMVADRVEKLERVRRGERDCYAVVAVVLREMAR